LSLFHAVAPESVHVSPSILSFPALEVAYHLAMIDEFMSSKIGIDELVQKNYEKKDLSPNVSAMVTRFNDVRLAFSISSNSQFFFFFFEFVDDLVVVVVVVVVFVFVVVVVVVAAAVVVAAVVVVVVGVVVAVVVAGVIFIIWTRILIAICIDPLDD
jgi:hypothetical protein